MPLCLIKLYKEGTPDDCSNRKRLARDTLLEFMATTLFLFSGIMSVMATGRQLSVNEQGEDVARLFPVAFAFGTSIMFLVYSIGHLTGGHMNPAVSLMMVFKREMSWTKMSCYWLAQFLGAMLGASLAWGGVSGAQGTENSVSATGTVPRPPLLLGSTTLSPVISAGNGFVLEFVGSFIFYLVIAQTALDKRGIAGSLFPAIPIGFSLIVVHLGLIPFTGCGVNPARTFGPSMVTCMAGKEQCDLAVDSWYWIYWIGPFLASLMVAEVTEWMSMDVEEVSDTGAEEPAEQEVKDIAEQDLPNVNTSETTEEHV